MAFCSKVHEAKRRALVQILSHDEVPLRAGALPFISSAIDDGVKVGLIAGTASLREDGVVEAIQRQVAPSEDGPLHVFTVDRGDPPPRDDRPASPTPPPVTLEASLGKRAAGEKMAAANLLAKELSISTDDLGRILGDASHLVTAAWLAACATILELDPERILVVASAPSLLGEARAAGFRTAAVPAALTAHASFERVAEYKFDGLEPGGGATYEKLTRLYT